MYLRMDLHVLLRYLHLASNCLVQKKAELGSCLAIVAILSLCHLEQLFLRCFKDLQALIILGNLIPIYEPFKLVGGGGEELFYMEIENTKRLPTF